ncbi:MAG: Xaa-Pro peptidase family protein [Clostridia bacterium]|nr:Xaa-Pro peptidase family protein [Clostridia bacterium]
MRGEKMMRMTPKTELENRIHRLQIQLQKENIDGALILQNADLYYFTGTIQQAYFFVPAEGKPMLFVIKGLDRARKESALEGIVSIEKLRDIPVLLHDLGYTAFETIGLEADVLPANLYTRYGKLFSSAGLVDVSGIIRSLRMVKSPYEIQLIREAAKMSESVFKSVRDHIKEGIKEFELVSMIEKISRENGHAGYIRPRGFNQEFGYVLLLSGPDAAETSFGSGPLGGRGISTAYPVGSSNRQILRDEPIILDYESWLEGYMTDMTRTFCLGKLPDYMVDAYNVAVEIQELMIEVVKPGAVCSELYAKVFEKVQKYNLQKHFMGLEKPVQFIAHGVGLEVDELPVVAPRVPTVIEKNMVVAIEPKFVFENGAVGIENTYTVGEHGLEAVTVFDESIQYV